MTSAAAKFRPRIKHILLGLLVAYVVMCQSCMTMRLDHRETKAFFDTLHVPYQSKILTIDNHRLHYVETGSANKPTVYFVHGSPGSWDNFRRYLADSLLRSKYRMVAVDRPGFGYSDFGVAEDLDKQSELLLQLIGHTNNHMPITLVGHSLGGPLIVRMAVERPAMFAQLVVLAGAVDPSEETRELWRRPLMLKPLRYLVPGALRPSNDELWWLKSDLVQMKPKLGNLTAHVTIVHGTKDPLVPYQNMAFMKREFTKAKTIDTIAIEDANHFIPWEHYEQIRDVLLKL